MAARRARYTTAEALKLILESDSKDSDDTFDNDGDDYVPHSGRDRYFRARRSCVRL